MEGPPAVAARFPLASPPVLATGHLVSYRENIAASTTKDHYNPHPSPDEQTEKTKSSQDDEPSAACSSSSCSSSSSSAAAAVETTTSDEQNNEQQQGFPPTVVNPDEPSSQALLQSRSTTSYPVPDDDELNNLGLLKQVGRSASISERSRNAAVAAPPSGSAASCTSEQPASSASPGGDGALERKAAPVDLDVVQVPAKAPKPILRRAVAGQQALFQEKAELLHEKHLDVFKKQVRISSKVSYQSAPSPVPGSCSSPDVHSPTWRTTSALFFRNSMLFGAARSPNMGTADSAAVAAATRVAQPSKGLTTSFTAGSGAEKGSAFTAGPAWIGVPGLRLGLSSSPVEGASEELPAEMNNPPAPAHGSATTNSSSSAGTQWDVQDFASWLYSAGSATSGKNVEGNVNVSASRSQDRALEKRSFFPAQQQSQKNRPSSPAWHGNNLNLHNQQPPQQQPRGSPFPAVWRQDNYGQPMCHRGGGGSIWQYQNYNFQPPYRQMNLQRQQYNYNRFATALGWNTTRRAGGTSSVPLSNHINFHHHNPHPRLLRPHLFANPNTGNASAASTPVKKNQSPTKNEIGVLGQQQQQLQAVSTGGRKKKNKKYLVTIDGEVHGMVEEDEDDPMGEVVE
ncbi:unnamed protein product [Amoebophrya sp. A120]|nr:unnamed protein product [Amoebophrya sp. A120]|eukprot:GSA120T00015702001.1